MKIFSVVIILLVLFSSGCAQTIWTHPTKNAQDFARDKYECEKIAEQSACNWGSCGNPFMMANEMQRCLQYKYGWTPGRKRSKDVVQEIDKKYDGYSEWSHPNNYSEYLWYVDAKECKGEGDSNFENCMSLKGWHKKE